MFTRTMESLSGVIPQVKQYLSGIQYPINKQSLIEFARSKGASGTITSLLDRLPDKQYHSEQEVSEELSSSTSEEMSGGVGSQSPEVSQGTPESRGAVGTQAFGRSGMKRE